MTQSYQGGWVFHDTLVTTQSPNSPFPFGFEFYGLGLGLFGLGLGLGLVIVANY